MIEKFGIDRRCCINPQLEPLGLRHEQVRTKLRYKTTNWPSYNEALKRRRSLAIWLDKDMQWFAAVSGKRGRSPKFSDAAIQFCLTLKNLFGLALRQNTGLVQSVLQLCGLAWPVPDFSTLCRRQLDLNVQVPYTRSQAGLHLLVDSTGLNSWVKASRSAKSMGLSVVASGANCTLELMPKHYRFEPSA